MLMFCFYNAAYFMKGFYGKEYLGDGGGAKNVTEIIPCNRPHQRELLGGYKMSASEQ